MPVLSAFIVSKKEIFGKKVPLLGPRLLQWHVA